MTLPEAVAALVEDSATIALEGFTHLGRGREWSVTLRKRF